MVTRPYRPPRRDELAETVLRMAVYWAPREIAEVVGVGQWTVRRWLRDAGARARPTSTRQRYQRARQEAREMYGRGLSTTDVAKRLGLPASTISTWTGDLRRPRVPIQREPASPRGRSTHWEEVSCRRSTAELEALLAERLHHIRPWLYDSSGMLQASLLPPEEIVR